LKRLVGELIWISDMF